MRWWDGAEWTDRVTDGGAPFDDHVDHAELRRLHESGGDLRARWPVWVVAVGITALVGADLLVAVLVRVVRGSGAPIAIGATATLLYCSLLACAVIAHRRLVPGLPFRDAFGLRWRWADIAWGFVLSIVARIAALAVILPIALLAPDLVRRSNIPAPNDIRGDIGLLIAVTLVAVVAAPLVEELFFRGLLQRSLETATPAWLAIAIASCIFGGAHVDVHAGWSNIGVVLGTATGGAVFGASARVTRRLGPSIVGHALFNAVPMGVLWAVR